MQFRVGKTYKDKRNRTHPEDEYNKGLSFKDEYSGVLSSVNIFQGVKFLNYINRRKYRCPAAFIFETSLTSKKRTKKSKGEFNNPWHDEISKDGETIQYWADAKYHPNKTLLEWNGCKKIQLSIDASLKDFSCIPPVLHFSRIEKGTLLFNGVFGIERITIQNFLDGDHNILVPNFLSSLKRLDTHVCDMNWIHERIQKGPLKNSNPFYWQEYLDTVGSKGIHFSDMRVGPNTYSAIDTIINQNEILDYVTQRDFLGLYAYLSNHMDKIGLIQTPTEKVRLVEHYMSR